MIRVPKLLQVNSQSQTIDCTITQTGCTCVCPNCSSNGNCCTDCADCPNLTLTDITLWVYRAGDVNPNTCTPNYLLTYIAFSWDPTTDLATFFIDSQLLALPPGRYIGEVRVYNNKAGNINFQLGAPFGICNPSISTTIGGDNDMQPSNPGNPSGPVNS